MKTVRILSENAFLPLLWRDTMFSGCHPISTPYTFRTIYPPSELQFGRLLTGGTVYAKFIIGNDGANVKRTYGNTWIFANGITSVVVVSHIANKMLKAVMIDHPCWRHSFGKQNQRNRWWRIISNGLMDWHACKNFCEWKSICRNGESHCKQNVKSCDDWPPVLRALVWKTKSAAQMVNL